jgi:hypothetical protein
VKRGSGNWVVKDENFAVPSEEFPKNFSAGPAQIDTYGQAELAAGLEACEKAVPQAEDSSEGYERRDEDDAIAGRLRCEECVDILA